MISELRVNGMVNPIGIGTDPGFSFLADEGESFTFGLYDGNCQKLYEQTVSLDDGIGFQVDFPFEQGKKYFWRVDESEYSYLFIADELTAPFISTDKSVTHPVFFKDFQCSDLKSARLVITGLGLYYAFINGKRVGNAYLAPGFNDYDDRLRYQTYDVTGLIKEDNRIEVVLGDGQYIGRMGFDGHAGNIYGDTYVLSAMLVLETKDGGETRILTDTSWKAHRSEFKFSTIYDGEIRDANIDQSECFDVFLSEKKFHLVPQSGSLIEAQDFFCSPRLIVSPKGEQILDFGQNMVGFAAFVDHLEKGGTIHLQYGEILQNGCFYRDNYRSAKAELYYTSDGVEKEVDTYFSFYGFRYVKVEGMEKVNPDDFKGVVLHTKLRETMKCTTSDEKINQLIHNALWGQKGNFLDVPTDCPQRDERLGWTGDAQVFAATACMNMDAKMFYKKYMQDIRADQVRYYDGDVPCYSPSLKGSASHGGAVWGDAATIIPVKLYEAYGDRNLLEEQFPVMKDYVDTLIKKDKAAGFTHIMTEDFTFGDWLAQDGFTEQSLKGSTDDTFIRSVYYLYSVENIKKACGILGKTEEQYYGEIAQDVKRAIRNEFFSESGRVCFDTQTSYILALYFHLTDNKEKLITGLKGRLERDLFKMKSGFTGTPLALIALMDNGLDEFAFRMLFSEECPGWLYAVNLGATTIWERWNSVLPDGTISGTGMNSLNHYAYGSVCEAIYTRIAGLKNTGNAYKNVIIEPHIDYRLRTMDMKYESVRGLYHISYKIDNHNDFTLDVTVPHGCSAAVRFPYSDGEKEREVGEGTHSFGYHLNKDFVHPFSMHTSGIDILNNQQAKTACRINPRYLGMIEGDSELRVMAPFDIGNNGFLPLSKEEALELDKALKEVEITI